MSEHNLTTSGDEARLDYIRSAIRDNEQDGDCVNPPSKVVYRRTEDNDFASETNRNRKGTFSFEFPEKFIRILCMFVDLGTEIVLNTFLFFTHNDIEAFLTTGETIGKLKILKEKHILTSKEFMLVTRRNLCPEHFDISLLVKLMRNLLPANTLEPPKSGWDGYPGQSDLSIAADLLRLRKVRNKIIAHSFKCHISESSFEKEWKTTVEVIIRITSKVLPEKVETIKEKINAYEKSPLDNEKFTQLLKTCQEELKDVQQKVAELLKTLNDFDVYFETRPGRYEKYMKLLLEGGHYVLRNILERELKRKETDLKSMLSEYKHNLLEHIHDPAHKEVLFPNDIKPSAEINPVKKWDISLLATTILTVFDKELSRNVKGEIKRIQTARESYADAAKSSLDGDQFLHCWGDLTGSIKCLAMVLDEDVKSHCDELIDKCQQRAGCDAEIDQLQTMCAGMKTLKDIYKEQVAELKQTLREMQDLEIPFGEPLTLDLKIITLGSSEEKTKMAEEILFTVWQEALSQVEDSTNFDEVRKAVKKILDSIRSRPGVTNVSVKHCCVVLSVQCSSYESMLHLLEYFSDNAFKECIDNIVEELRFGLDAPFIMTAALTLESLHDVKASLQRQNCDTSGRVSKSTICIPITFSSVNGIKNVWSYLNSTEFSEATNEMKSALLQSTMEFSQGDITLKANIDSFSKLFKETESGIFSPDAYIGGNDETVFETENFDDGFDARPAKRRRIASSNGDRNILGLELSKTQISIGDSIRPCGKDKCGTVGPFVRIKETGEMCFLTVRHIFGPLVKKDSDVRGTQVYHTSSTHISGTSKSEKRICGEVIACEYSEWLDAAVVKLSKDKIPNRYRFTSVVYDMCREKDLANIKILKYANIQSSIEATKLSSEEREKMRLVKIGSSTGLTEGSFVLDSSKETINTNYDTVLLEHHEPPLWEAVPYQSHIHIRGIGSETFATEGDDGAAVYLVDENNYLHCIGILCLAKNESRDFLVTPIETVLERLGKEAGCTFEIDTYEQETDTINQYETNLFNCVLQREERDRHIRINIVGFFAEGKTTLTRRLLNESLEDYCCTDGIDVHVRRCKMNGKQWTVCEAMNLIEECARRLVDVVDIEYANATEEEIGTDYQKTNGERRVHFQQDGFVNEHTNKQIQATTSSRSAQNKQGSSSTQPFYFLKGLEEQNRKLMRVFSKNLRNKGDENDRRELIANIWDFGGQFIYYATHQIFHTRDAIYLLCFDLTKDLETMIIDCDFPDRKEMMKNSLLFWVNSIYASVVGEDMSSENPVIILVGTHRDRFHGDIDKKFDKVFDLFTKTELRYLIYDKPFAVASKDKNDYAVDELRNTIYELGLERSKTRMLPTKWIPLEVAMLEDSEKSILRFKDIESMNTKMTYPLQGEQEIKSFLNYHHAKGTIVFFDEDVLSNYVVTKPQFLVDAFKCLITAKWFCRWNKDFRNGWKKLTNEAVLEMSLLNEVWSEDKKSNFIEYKDILLLFLERQRILAEIQRMDEITGEITSLGKYMIPSMLTRDLDSGTLLDFVRQKRYSPVIIGLEIGNEVLTTVYDKVTAALLGMWPPLEYNGQILVFQNGGFFRLDLQHACMIRKTDVSIELMLVNLCPSDVPDNIICDRFRRYVEMAIAHRKIRSNSQEKTYYIKCNDTQHRGMGSHCFHYLHDIKESINVCCPDNKSHSINVHEATALWFLEKTILPTEADAIRKATLEDKLVERIAKEFGTNWKVLGIQIGLSVEELGLIDTGNDKTIVNIVHMFKVWMNKYPDLHKYNCEMKGSTFFDKKTSEGWDKFRNCFDF